MIEADFCVFAHLLFYPSLFVQNMAFDAGRKCRGHVNYGQPMANVRVSIDGQSIPFEANPLDTSLLGWWLNLSGLQVGEHDLVIEAFDGLGTTVSTFQSSIFVQEIKADVRLNGRRIGTGLGGSKGVPFGDPLPVLIDYEQDVANVRVSIDGQSIPFEANPLGGSLKNWWLNLSGLTVGDHDVLIEAFDGQGQKVETFESPIAILDVESTVRIGGIQIASGEFGGKGVPTGNHRVEIEAFDGEGKKVSAYESAIWVFP